jgi:hypothetical protein
MSFCDTEVTALESSRAAAVESAATTQQTGHTINERITRLLWHYTHESPFFAIMSEGLIRPATAHVGPEELPITWFSNQQLWEPSVFKGKLQPNGRIKDLDMAGMLASNIRLFRFGVDFATAPYCWSELQELSGMDPWIAAGIARSARRRGGSQGVAEDLDDPGWTGDRLDHSAVAQHLIDLLENLSLFSLTASRTPSLPYVYR